VNGQALTTLTELLTHRWNIAVLAELQRSSGAKFVTLAKRLGVRRGSLSSSLRHLVANGLVRRNAGYGHPLRPEYLLSKRGVAIGGDCQALAALVRGQGADKVAYRKWPLPILLAIGVEKSRFNALRAALGDITPRAQTLALKSLHEAGWIRREVDSGYPPVATYEVSQRGREIHALLQRICDHR